MAHDEVTIYNLALSAAGSKAVVTSPTEKSREAELCNLWYDTVRQTVLKSASWPCSLTHRALGITAERDMNVEWADGDPAPGYLFAYHEPEDMLAPRYLASYAQFSRTYVGGQPAINTNDCKAILAYVRDETRIDFWDEGLRSAVYTTLGAAISLELTGKSFIYDRLMRQAETVVLKNQTELANENDQYFDSDPSWITAQHFDGPQSTSRYFVPYASLKGIAP